ncbi:MAG TPA: acyl-CoA dehydrogenase family protein [Dehalococcoidia bacterium]|jgi:alkylation response protein AidB-like acyl-CoA dehydrogenase|nr:acyl-CoA dehydrogenase family protein [Dehalococcoidia bacterium]
MDFHDTPKEAAFRQEVRAFIQTECPPGIRRRGFSAMFGGGGWEDFRMGTDEYRKINSSWAKKLAGKGWIAPAWPKEYGGAGMTVMEQFIFKQEMSTAGAPSGGNYGIGVGWAGPTIILYGNEEQKQKYLPDIVRGDAVWCQGFSEPGAGSDLASLQTRAVKDGDDYVINGQKIWTSGAHVAQFMILLARTDAEAPKHKGISYFILDMKSPGIEVRPLINMAGNHDFNEVFFDNVRVPKENLIGEENRGWYVGTTTLDFERSGIATSVSHGHMVRDLAKFVVDNRNEGFISKNPHLRIEIADRAVEAEVEQMLCTQVVSMQNRGLVPNKESSIAKLFSSELDVRISQTAMKTLGLYGQLRRDSERTVMNGRVESTYLYATTSVVGGGTSEIQRNIIASRGLGLPRD